MLRQTKNPVPQKIINKPKESEFPKAGSLSSRSGLGQVDTTLRLEKSKQRYRERLSAKRVFDRIYMIPIDNRTQREVQSLAWAKKNSINLIKRRSRRRLSKDSDLLKARH